MNPLNFEMSANIKEAKRINRNFIKKLNRLRIKTRNGDKPACIKTIQVMTEMELAVKKLGCRITDDGKIVERTQEWIDEQIKKQPKIDKLSKLARNGNIDAINELILIMANS